MAKKKNAQRTHHVVKVRRALFGACKEILIYDETKSVFVQSVMPEIWNLMQEAGIKKMFVNAIVHEDGSLVLSSYIEEENWPIW